MSSPNPNQEVKLDRTVLTKLVMDEYKLGYSEAAQMIDRCEIPYYKAMFADEPVPNQEVEQLPKPTHDQEYFDALDAIGGLDRLMPLMDELARMFEAGEVNNARRLAAKFLHRSNQAAKREALEKLKGGHSHIDPEWKYCFMCNQINAALKQLEDSNER